MSLDPGQWIGDRYIYILFISCSAGIEMSVKLSSGEIRPCQCFA